MSYSTRYFQQERLQVAKLLPRHYSRILEVGCGEGVFRNNLDQEHEYWGVEPIESIAKLAQGKLDKVLIGTYEAVENIIPNNYFDLVICNDVIEHMPDQDVFLQSISKKIKKDGVLVGSIPNVRHILNLWDLLVKKDWEYKNKGILDRTHLRFFTMKSLLRTFSDNAFSVEQFVGITCYQPRHLFDRILYFFMMLLFGRDIRFLQFGFRVKKIGSDRKDGGIHLSPTESA